MSLLDREIKFRAWNGLRIISSNDVRCNGGFALREGLSSMDLLVIPTPKYEVMQYTGLKDKKGVEIYEGDIIDYDGEIAKVTYENIMASFCVGGNNFDNSEAKYMKVIGNIYENPELLEV